MLMNMKELLAVARVNKFAVPAFNIASNMLLRGVIEASEESSSPVILAIHPDELAFLQPSFVRAAVQDEGAGLHPPRPRLVAHADHGGHKVRLHVGDDGRFDPTP